MFLFLCLHGIPELRNPHVQCNFERGAWLCCLPLTVLPFPFFACHHLLRLQLGRSLHALLVVVAQVASLQSLYKSIYVSHVFSQHITIPRYAHRRDSRHGRGRVKMPRSHSNDRNGRGRVNQLTRRIVGPLGSCFSLLPLASGLYDESAWPDLVLMRHQFDV